MPSRQRRLSRIKERFIEALLFLAALSSVAITLGIVFILAYESSTFFAHGLETEAANNRVVAEPSYVRVSSIHHY